METFTPRIELYSQFNRQAVNNPAKWLISYVFQKTQDEVDSWQKKVDNLTHQAQKLCDEYQNDDTSKIKTMVEDIKSEWTRLLSR